MKKFLSLKKLIKNETLFEFFRKTTYSKEKIKSEEKGVAA